MQFDFNLAITLGGYASFVIGGFLYARSKVPNQTIDNYEKLSVAQEKRIKALEDQSKADQQNHLENIKGIADLQGQIKVYKELPLQEMATAMTTQTATLQKISDRLDMSAAVLAKDTASVLHDTQIVANELKAANAVNS
jgi:hypothetical protein